jgi:bisphosphoglycerate-independent phosphoglycerate mutase (AlkP superfamily)
MSEAAREAYQAGEDDETLEPRVLVDSQGKPIGRFRDGDYVIFYNLAMLGRRGEKKESGARYLEMIEKELGDLRLGRLVSVIGRYWSLDREENRDRIEKTYRMLVYGDGQKVFSP